jgi:ABC-type Fe3+/spermidine/putrescine transport system ATPase subunit
VPLARSLVLDPAVLLLDTLDFKLRAEMKIELNQL